jgi:CubicO group peptidase (beta-lactamase class C family)
LIHGTVAQGFERVRDAFVANFARGEIGAALCVSVRGQRVVDLWAGWADREREMPWEADTPCVVFSVTKGFVGTCFLALQDRGGIDLDAPIATYWPEFAGGDAGATRAGITVRTLLNHRSGLCAVDRGLTIEDLKHDERVESALLAQEPLWEPGTDQGYHATSLGMYAQAIFRRAAGRSLGRFFAEELAGPLGADAWIGLPEEVHPRTATLYPTAPLKAVWAILSQLPRDTVEGRMYRRVLFDRKSAAARAVANPRELGAGRFTNLNRADVRRLELPWMGGHATARGVSRIYEPLANGGSAAGVRIVSPEAIEPLKLRQSWSDRDLVVPKPMGFSQGFLKDQTHLFCPNPEMFGHAGMGGSLGFADPVEGVAFGYVMNHMAPQVRSTRALALCHALYASLGRPIPAAS